MREGQLSAAVQVKGVPVHAPFVHVRDALPAATNPAPQEKVHTSPDTLAAQVAGLAPKGLERIGHDVAAHWATLPTHVPASQVKVEVAGEYPALQENVQLSPWTRPAQVAATALVPELTVGHAIRVQVS